jgi:hypothetical protein
MQGTAICPNGHANPTGQAFCGTCGAQLVNEVLPSAPPPSPSAEPPRVNQQPNLRPLFGLVVLVAVGILVYNVASNGNGGFGGGGSIHTVRYEVLESSTSTAQSADMTFQTGSQDTSQEAGAAVPWHDEEMMYDGDFYYIAAQNNDGGGISCWVYVDGEVADHIVSSGDYAIATCSGTVGVYSR